jgi:hypothetical protein
MNDSIVKVLPVTARLQNDAADLMTQTKKAEQDAQGIQRIGVCVRALRASD